jgi:hypothetical protein
MSLEGGAVAGKLVSNSTPSCAPLLEHKKNKMIEFATYAASFIGLF